VTEFITGQAILSLSEYKTMRGITDATRDSQLTLGIAQAEDAVIRFTGRDFKKVPAVETRKYPLEGPIVNIDDAGEITQVSVDGYGLVSDTNYIAQPYGEGVVYWLDLGEWWGRPASPLMGFTRNEDTLSQRTFRFVSVTASFGWPAASLPPVLKLATALIVDEAFSAAADNRGISAEAVADTSVVYESPEPASAPASLPPAVEELLNPFRRITL